MHPLTTNKTTPTQDVHSVGFESAGVSIYIGENRPLRETLKPTVGASRRMYRTISPDVPSLNP
jgi:hypothetical protein